MTYDREKTQMQETGVVYVAGMSVAAIAQIVSDLGISPYSAWVTGRGELVSGERYATAAVSIQERSAE